MLFAAHYHRHNDDKPWSTEKQKISDDGSFLIKADNEEHARKVAQDYLKACPDGHNRTILYVKEVRSGY